MRRNIEIKARLASLAKAREIARTLTGGPPTVEHQIDTYFEVTSGRLKLREINGQNAQLVWYERPDAAEARGSDYLLTSIGDGSGLRETLTRALRVIQIVEKQREISLHGNVRIHLDQVQRLGDFLEFEAVLGEGIDDAAGHQQVADLLERFAIGPEDCLAVSYCDLLNQCG